MGLKPMIQTIFNILKFLYTTPSEKYASIGGAVFSRNNASENGRKKKAALTFCLSVSYPLINIFCQHKTVHNSQ